MPKSRTKNKPVAEPLTFQPPIGLAMLWSSAANLAGTVAGLHFLLDPQGKLWGDVLVWSALATLIASGLIFVGLWAKAHRQSRWLIAAPMLGPLFALVIWLFQVFGHTAGLDSILSTTPLLIMAAIWPAIFFGFLIGLFRLQPNGRNYAVVLSLIGLAWIGYQTTVWHDNHRTGNSAFNDLKICAHVGASYRNDCYKQVAAAHQDVALCNQKFTDDQPERTSCFQQVAMATDRTEYCLGPENEAKLNCLKEIAIDRKNLAACQALPTTSPYPNGVTYQFDCYRRILDTLTVPDSTNLTADMNTWCQAVAAYPSLLDLTPTLQSAKTNRDKYCLPKL